MAFNQVNTVCLATYMEQRYYNYERWDSTHRIMSNFYTVQQPSAYLRSLFTKLLKTLLCMQQSSVCWYYQ